MPETWWLDDAERLNEESPDSFFIPPREKRHSLQVGDSVKLVFRLSPSVEGPGAERMWVEVTSVEDAGYRGLLLNAPAHIRSLAPGDAVTFGPQHVAAYAWSPEELGYDPELAAWVRIESSVPRGSRPALVTMRQPPDTRDPEWDSGWTLGRGDETGEELSDESVFRWIELGWLTDLHPELEAVFRAGEGFWRWDADASAYVRIA